MAVTRIEEGGLGTDSFNLPVTLNGTDGSSTHAGDNIVLDASASGVDAGERLLYEGIPPDSIDISNSISVLSGATLTVDSGATIVNSGTATGFGSNEPTSADGQALGSTSAEWSDLYLADSSVIYFGNDQDVTLTHDPDDGLLLNEALAVGDGTVALPTLTNVGDLNTGIYYPAADTVGVTAGGTEQLRFGRNPIPGGQKNMVHNGAFTISQRGTSFAISPNASGTDSEPSLDRWILFAHLTDSDYTVTQASLTPGTDEPYDPGFRNSIKVDCTTAAGSPGATDTLSVNQKLEGFNVQRLGYGDAQAKESTVSFWHKHTKTGTNCVTIQVSGGSKWASKQYTQSVSNTWEYATVTIPGDTATAPANDNAARLDVMFGVAVGSTYTSGSEAAWGTTNGNYFPGQVNNMDSTSNNFEITGVQWEVGSVATSFAHEDYGTTFRKCSRYLQYFGPVAAGEFDRFDGYAWKAASADTINSGYWMVNLDARARMRAAPTFTTSGVGATNWKVYSGNRQLNVISVMTGGGFAQAITSGHATIYIEATGSDFVVGNSMILVAGTSGSTYYYFTAELQT